MKNPASDLADGFFRVRNGCQRVSGSPTEVPSGIAGEIAGVSADTKHGGTVDVAERLGR
jgi:hypothetical protein